MGQGHLLDSNVIIDFLSGALPADGMRFVSDIVNAVPQVSVISKIENRVVAIYAHPGERTSFRRFYQRVGRATD